MSGNVREKGDPLTAKQLQILPISCQVKTFSNTATILRNQRRYCHPEERSDEEPIISPPAGERYREGGLRDSTHED